MTGNIELAGERTFECKAGGAGSWGLSVGVGCKSTDHLHNDFSGGTVEVVDAGDGGMPGPKDGMVVGMLLMLGFGCTNDPEERAGRVMNCDETSL